MPRSKHYKGFSYGDTAYRAGGRYGRGKAKRRARFRRGRKIPKAMVGFLRTGGYFGKDGSGGELKFHDIDLNDTLISLAATITDSVIKIAQGTTESTRVGRKCTIRNIGWKFEILLNGTAAANINAVDVLRVILYLDRQCNGATATATEILESDDYQSFNNLSNKQRFYTLMDRTYDLNQTAAAGNGTANDTAPRILSDSFYKKVNIPVEFSSTTGAITEIRSNNIGVMLISKTGDLMTFASKFRFRFTG